MYSLSQMLVNHERHNVMTTAGNRDLNDLLGRDSFGNFRRAGRCKLSPIWACICRTWQIKRRSGYRRVGRELRERGVQMFTMGDTSSCRRYGEADSRREPIDRIRRRLMDYARTARWSCVVAARTRWLFRPSRLSSTMTLLKRWSCIRSFVRVGQDFTQASLTAWWSGVAEAALDIVQSPQSRPFYCKQLISARSPVSQPSYSRV